jgi:hypothetical protein
MSAGVTDPRRRSPLYRGLVLAALHLLLVSTLGAKLLYDRSTRPRIWVETAPYDPDLPIRGRYVSLRLIVEAPDITPPSEAAPGWSWHPVTLHLERDHLVARSEPEEKSYSEPSVRFVKRGNAWIPVLNEPVAFFIPEHADDPSRRNPGESLWVEVTLPRVGPPRPIRLGVRTDGPITPLPLAGKR